MTKKVEKEVEDKIMARAGGDTSWSKSGDDPRRDWISSRFFKS